MKWLPEVFRKEKKDRAARVSVESLENRSLLANGLGTVFALAAKDTLDVNRLGLIAGLQQAQVNNTLLEQQVIQAGQARTAGLVGNIAAIYNAGVGQTNPANLLFLNAAAQGTLNTGLVVRGLMRTSNRVYNNTNASLVHIENSINRVYNNSVKNLNRGNNPFLTVIHSVNTQDALALRGAGRAALGNLALTAIGNAIVNPINGF